MGCTQLHIAQPVFQPLSTDIQGFGQIQNFARVTPRTTLVIRIDVPNLPEKDRDVDVRGEGVRRNVSHNRLLM